MAEQRCYCSSVTLHRLACETDLGATVYHLIGVNSGGLPGSSVAAGQALLQMQAPADAWQLCLARQAFLQMQACAGARWQ